MTCGNGRQKTEDTEQNNNSKKACVFERIVAKLRPNKPKNLAASLT
jgi:hypothetical protein